MNSMTPNHNKEKDILISDQDFVVIPIHLKNRTPSVVVFVRCVLVVQRMRPVAESVYLPENRVIRANKDTLSLIVLAN